MQWKVGDTTITKLEEIVYAEFPEVIPAATPEVVKIAAVYQEGSDKDDARKAAHDQSPEEGEDKDQEANQENRG